MAALAGQLRALIRKEDRIDGYNALVDGLVRAGDLDGLAQLVEFLCTKELEDQFGRLYITPPVSLYVVDEILNDEKQEKMGLDVIEMEDLIPFLTTVSAHLRGACEQSPQTGGSLHRCLLGLSMSHRSEGDFKQAAFALISMKFENVEADHVTSTQKVDWYVQAAEDWLEIAESGSAYEAIGMANKYFREVDQDDEKEGRPVATRYLLCFARIQDYRRKFVDAAKRYFDLTLSGVMGQEDLERTLQNAVTCCILGQAGPSRSRVLGLLHGDERTHNLANFPMLQAMYKDQLVRPEDSKAFQRLLAEHQNVTISGGITVLQQSVIQHNLVAVSRVYKNISFEELGRILGISADKSEEIGAGMINAGVLEGATIDQVDGFLEFSASSSSSAGSEGGSSSNPQLKQWDEAIGSICAEIQSSFSALVEARQAAQ